MIIKMIIVHILKKIQMNVHYMSKEEILMPRVQMLPRFQMLVALMENIHKNN